MYVGGADCRYAGRDSSSRITSDQGREKGQGRETLRAVHGARVSRRFLVVPRSSSFVPRSSRVRPASAIPERGWRLHAAGSRMVCPSPTPPNAPGTHEARTSVPTSRVLPSSRVRCDASRASSSRVPAVGAFHVPPSLIELAALGGGGSLVPHPPFSVELNASQASGISLSGASALAPLPASTRPQ